MTGVDRLLLPLDGSEQAEVALRWLEILPARQVRLLHVCPAKSPEGGRAVRYLSRLAARHCTAGREIETRVVHGDPAGAIVADATDRDLIVMCTQGAGGGGRLMFGSVADRVARHAPVPALLLRGGNAPVASAPVQRIVVPLDGSAAAARALPFAGNLGMVLGMPLTLVSVVEPAEGAGEAELQRSAYLEEKADALQSAGTATSTAVVRGTPGAALMAMIGPGDLLVLTTHGHGPARRWQIGRVAEKLVRQAPAPVVLVRADTP